MIVAIFVFGLPREIRNNYGELDLEMVLRKTNVLHDRYDENGNKYDYKRGYTFCTHKFSKSGDPGVLMALQL